MKFRILTRLPSGTEVWEDYDKQIGESNFIPGAGQQPKFLGDVEAWGRAIIDWFNKDEPPERHRTFVRGEILPEDPKPIKPVKRIRYLYDDAFKFDRRGEPAQIHYIRAWKGEGRGRNAELIVQVWLDKNTPEGEPNGDWAMPYVLGVPGCIRQAVLQTV